MITHHQLVRHALSWAPVEHNGESWHVTSLTACTDQGCPQRLTGHDCAGIVDLVNAYDSRFTTGHLHARTGEVPS